MITEIAEHSVDLSILPEKALILDAGCRGWAFHDYFKKLGHSVLALDIDGDVAKPDSSSEVTRVLHVMALTDFNGWVGKTEPNDPQATMIDKKGEGIQAITLPELVKTFGQFDLIKLDIEGAEYQVIMSLHKAPAKQLSVEFHLHTGVYKQFEVDLMVDKLKALGYVAVQHNLEERHCAGYNYWDSLFIKK